MFLDLLFPNRCLSCNTIISSNELACMPCFEKINFTHWDFNTDNPLKRKCRLLFPVEHAFALMQFEKDNLSRKIVHELKYHGREKVAKNIAEWTIEKLKFGAERPGLLISVPLHPKKEKERGYNQLHLYTEELSKHYNIPFCHNIFKRNFYKKAQALKDRAQRSDTQNVFALNKPLTNTHVLLVDDVFTTGNTLSALAWEILKSGDNKVSVLVMAVD